MRNYLATAHVNKHQFRFYILYTQKDVVENITYRMACLKVNLSRKF